MKQGKRFRGLGSGDKKGLASSQPQSPDQELETAYEAFAPQKTVRLVDPHDSPHIIFFRQ